MLQTFPELVVAIDTTLLQIQNLNAALRAYTIRKDQIKIEATKSQIANRKRRLSRYIDAYETKMRQSYLETKLWEKKLNELKELIQQYQ